MNPFNNQTYKVYDLCRSRDNYPYELDYGYATAVCDTTDYAEHNPNETFQGMLSPEARLIRIPMRSFSNREIGEMIAFAEDHLPSMNEYQSGYKQGYTDANVHHFRETFAEPDEHSVSFCAGYELGVYIGMERNSGSTIPPELSFFREKVQ